MFSFQSSRRISQVAVSNVKLFEFFSPSCYILIEQAGTEFKIKCYSSFGEDSLADQCNEFDLSFPSDPVSKTSTVTPKEFAWQW